MYEDDDRLVLSASDLVGHLACSHHTVLALAEVAGTKARGGAGEEDGAVAVVRKRGLEHEAAYLASLKGRGLGVVEIRVSSTGAEALREAEASTVRAMKDGVEVVFQGTFFEEAGAGPKWRGHADFLRKVGGGYEPEDTKLARRVKPAALLQLCLYAEQVERLLGTVPEAIHVVLGDQRRVSFSTRALSAYYRHAKARFVDAAHAADPGTYPVPVEYCGVCRHAAACEARREADDHLSGVANLTREQVRKLEGVGIATVAALASSPAALRVKGIGDETLVRLRRQARLQVQSRLGGAESPPAYELLERTDGGSTELETQGLEALPEPSRGDLFFDMEGDPYAVEGGLEYLLGVGWYDDADAFQFRTFWGHNLASEKSSFEAFMDFVAERRRAHPDLHIYHYASYEVTALGKLMGRHATREIELDDLMRGRVFVDLYRVVRQGVAIGSPSYSIKKLEPLYMAPRAGAITDAGSSIVQYERWLETGEQQILDDIEKYNRDDVESTGLLRGWLEERRRDVERASGVALRRPSSSTSETSEQAVEVADEAAVLVERLTVGVATCPPDSDSEPHARWLLAQLVGWHRREEKPEWWKYFHRVLECTDEDLVDDSETIGGLIYEGAVGTVKSSTIHRYRFDPEQEHKISVGSPVEDPASKRAMLERGEEIATCGSVVAVDLRGGSIDLKRGKASEAPHPQSLIPPGPIKTDVLKQAIARIATDVADRGIAADGLARAARGLLLRAPPRVRGVPPGAPLFNRATERNTVEVAKRLALGLEESYLPIQGPPGSGKTHTAARVILALVRAGRKVGVTANSHAVICHVLKKVVEAAAEERVTVRIMQKGTKEQAYDHPGVKVVAKTDAIEEALVAGTVDLVAGTAWLFAHDKLEGKLDHLLIDEAGQMSLANVVATGKSARNLILVGDPQQLPQPGKGTHPPGAESSALEYVLGTGVDTIPDDRGLFLDQTHRLHPAICTYISELAYEQRLGSAGDCERQSVASGPLVHGSGLRWAPVLHEGNRTSAREEVEAVAALYGALLGRLWTGPKGKPRPMTAEDVLVVAPYNAQVHLLAERLPVGARVGTVDKFQGQEAAVVIVSMTASSAEEVPRGMEFLFSKNRLNVAVSRARALSVLVASPTLLAAQCRTVEQMFLVNGLCRFVELAELVDVEPEPVNESFRGRTAGRERSRAGVPR